MNMINERYIIKEDGSIYSLYSRFGKRKKPLRITPQLRKDGYYQIGLVNDFGKKKMFLVHRVVASKFIPNPNNLPEVNHINGDKLDNSVANLEWVTRSDNLRHRYHVLGYKIQGCIKDNYSKRIKVKCLETGKIFDSINDAARYVDKNIGNIYQSFRTGCRCGGYHWEKCSGEML